MNNVVHAVEFGGIFMSGRVPVVISSNLSRRMRTLRRDNDNPFPQRIAGCGGITLRKCALRPTEPI